MNASLFALIMTGATFLIIGSALHFLPQEPQQLAFKYLHIVCVVATICVIVLANAMGATPLVIR